MVDGARAEAIQEVTVTTTKMKAKMMKVEAAANGDGGGWWGKMEGGKQQRHIAMKDGEWWLWTVDVDKDMRWE